MKRALGPVLLGVLVLAAVVPFVLPWKDGRPLLDYRQLRWPALPDIRLPAADTDQAAQAPVTVYKWRDAAGAWQFGGSPPDNGVPFETVSIDPGANRLQGIDPARADVVTTAHSAASPPTDVADAYSPARIQQTLEAAREVQSALNRRVEEQAALLHAR